jgi:uncharacterized protein YukE
MSELKFDDGEAGVQSTIHWNDSQTFTNIAGGYKGMLGDCADVADSLVDGSSALSEACSYFAQLMNAASQQFSEAASLLGSGIKSAAADFANTDSSISEDFAFMMLGEDD